MNTLNFVLAGFLTAAMSHASAGTWSISQGSYSQEAGAVHETFDSLLVDPNESLDLDYSGGALFGASIQHIAARPPGSVGQYLSVGLTGGQSGPVTVDLNSMPATYYGFLWGSPDKYNQVTIFDGETILADLRGGDVFGSALANGYQGTFAGGQYFNFFADQGELITSVVFNSTSNALETDNHAIVAYVREPLVFGRLAISDAPIPAVPEPSSYALLLAGLGAVAFVVRRRVRT